MMTPRIRLLLIGLTTWLAVVSPAWRPVAASDDLVRVEMSEEIMGSSFSLVLYGKDRPMLESAGRAAMDEAHRLDRLLSNYRSDSPWSAVNRDAAKRAVSVPPELFDLLSACLDYSRQTGGAFDVTVGPLTRLWGFHDGDGALPRPTAIAETLQRVGYRHLRLDRGRQAIRFSRPGMELDPGGVGKGYAVDRMVGVLREHHVGVGLISASGSSIYGMGAPPDEPRGWRITIGAPDQADRAASVVFLKDVSMSTSGSYGKFFRAAGRNYAHILDPRTGYPAQGTALVSVIAPRTIDSEVWTKPYFINGRAWTAAHRRPGHRVFFCEDVARAPCDWVR
jgi:thiamine biosynthesis lipoprotein